MSDIHYRAANILERRGWDPEGENGVSVIDAVDLAAPGPFEAVEALHELRSVLGVSMLTIWESEEARDVDEVLALLRST